MTETQLSAQIGRWLDEQQALHRLTHDRYNSGVAAARSGRRIAMAARGTADRIVRVRLDGNVCRGRRLARPVMLEVKAPGNGVLCPPPGVDWRDEKMCRKYAQYRWLKAQFNVGAYCCVVHSLPATMVHIQNAALGDDSPGPEQWAARTDA